MGATASAIRLIKNFQEARQKKSLLQKVRDYRGYVPIRYETDAFMVTTAESGSQLLKVLELRHEIFIEEWQGRRIHHGLDVDQYDFIGDHLLITDKERGEVVGTYRLLCSHFTHDFYSASEFRIDDFLRVPAVKLEMGRACIKHDYRNGNTIDLLWKGLGRYITATKADYLFGCSSLRTTDPGKISDLMLAMHEDGHWSDTYRIRPEPDYIFPGFLQESSTRMAQQERRALIPPLLRSYLSAGAKVYGWPALDREFECTDLFTILDWRELNPRFRARFVD